MKEYIKLRERLIEINDEIKNLEREQEKIYKKLERYLDNTSSKNLDRIFEYETERFLDNIKDLASKL